MSNSAADRSQRPMRVAIIGAGPAGVYAADILTKADRDFEVSIDLFDKYPAPYGLIRYGVAPDHPRIKGIVNALHKVMDRGDIRFLGNVHYGKDLTLTDFRHFYDAIIFATGAIKDADMSIPGVELEGSFGGADFVSWYDGHPDVPREWPLDAKEVAVIGNGNVALDVARILSKHADDLLTTEIPDNVYEGLKKSPVTDVHIFGRRGPAQVKFTPLELRELSHSRDVDIVLYPEDFEFDEGSDEQIRSNNQTKTMVNTLTNWLVEEQDSGASRRLHLHFLHSPVEIYEDPANPGKVAGMKFERNELDGTGNARGTGEIVDYPVQAVYRAIGYFGSELPEVGFDSRRGVIPNEGGRVIDETGAPVPGIYTTGWIKRGPVGLIGHTKGDALETIGFLLEDRLNLPAAEEPEEDSIIKLLEDRGVEYVTWEGWLKLDAYEKSLGASYIHPDPATGELVRERVKVVDREEMIRVARGQ
ncbi:FAD-dependent oxidoreductase [Arthrobacter sp. zg-Y820]|uniref:FAD-dependent oxidoreductase n=1 Tax=unclassified Arthrobacter TaxID=235627 RepID=UPI00253F87DF|nr:MULTISPECIES: FAD-dependent oxidoreductase [unclassified Arthrobacter]MCC9195698.1 FAD-dependent oxidoreductase [Arthrobacter sp. zg-Y820]MDK1278557.1 FAD-dependent oxidoreductase [Arthrobacter sp. zg.Y820]MDK1359845.1 FAD-dependent oxidoreductase [Arthrobacter sp. zg-Y1219]WIB09008.1 FAD-dependent oxidoreductase [Arthrobacter sp. zg-Y820]